MDKIKICHFGLNSEIGGIETYLFNIVSCIDKSKFLFDFITYKSERLAFQSFFEKNGSTIYRLKNQRRRFFNKKTINELVSFFQLHKFDAIEIHVVDLYDLIPVVAAHKSGIKSIIIHSHSSGFYGNPTLFVKAINLVNKFRIRFYPVKFIGCSSMSLHFTFGHSNGFVFQNDILSEKFIFNEEQRRLFRKKYDINNNSLVICNVGRLCKEKNQLFLINVFKEIQIKNNDSYLLIAGDGELLQSLKAYCSLLNIHTNVIFLGKVNNVSDIYSASDIFVFPSLSEGYGIALVEALSSGLKSFCSNDIPNEISDNNLLTRLSIQCDPQIWAKNILSTNLKYGRFKESIRASNKYNLKSSITKLERFYYDAIKK